MPLQLLLLLILLGPGSSLQLWGTWADEAKKALGPLLARNRRQATEYEYLDYDFLPETEPPEILSNSTNTTPLTGPGNPESTTVKPAARHSTGLDTGGSVTELTMELANMGTLSMDSAAMEVQTTHPAATEAQTTPLAATEALTTQLVATEAQTTPLAATEAQTTQPIATEAQTTPLAATEALSTESNAMEALSTEPNATEALSMEPTTKKGLFIPFSVSSVTHKGIPMAASNLSINHPVGSPDHISVKQCLLGILILALVATIFLVCTVVLAVRLSRKGHMYPVRNYSPTEMVCISSLLPDGGEGPSALANGGLPKAKSQGLTPEPGEDRDGDDLTLHSFLP
ncbi:PREDICTED: P-selectin glycoprotein ligand 1 isoform X6 [Mandrillus leucophaeus]|uniref:P-selectin glycoprotein ligand 1 isoform X6 n=1 Tax=Mandrillus leucophaeus TaxID=9568 RepID=UPI0005F564B7|nr:PREDICTED: P-selectin glycoprotein ligand 1 isoform X6 [Mandrillus leucophaeus]